MRANIRDIIDAVGCDEERAKEIENYIDRNDYLDWSECEMSELHDAAISAHQHMMKGGISG